MLPINKYQVCKIGINKTQVLRRMRMRQSTTRQPPPDIRIKPQEWQPDPEVSLKQDDMYARAWECEYEKPIFDAESNNATLSKSCEFPVKLDLSTEKMWKTPGTAQECSPIIFPQTDEFCDLT